MNRLKMVMHICVLAAVLTTLMLTAKVVEAASLKCGTWSVVSSPNVGSGSNELSAVAAISASNVWMVGYYQNSSNIAQTLIEHWNGTSWSVVPSPNVGSSNNYLAGVSAVSASNVWAVGSSTNSSNIDQTLVEHWNGTSWSVVPSPNVGSSYNFFYAVAAVSASNVWAVGGYSLNGNFNQTLIEQWNGTSWSVVPSPEGGSGNNVLNGVAAVSANNIWAVGSYNNSNNIVRQTLIERWNGTSWSVVPSPNVGPGTNDLNGVARVPGSSNIWAVGTSYDSSGYTNLTLIEKWNGTSWSVVPSPNGVSSSHNTLYGVAAIAASNVWAVGNYFFNSNVFQTLIEHWNGTRWSIVPSPNAGSDNNYLYGVARVPASSKVWTVGSSKSSSGIYQTLTEFYC